eukprot:13902606-Ditylum_brightwellii.AAC.1
MAQYQNVCAVHWSTYAPSHCIRRRLNRECFSSPTPILNFQAVPFLTLDMETMEELVKDGEYSISLDKLSSYAHSVCALFVKKY